MAEEFELAAESLADLLARFDDLHDGEVRAVDIAPLESAIVVEVHADDTRANNRRCRLRFSFKEVTAWCFEGGTHVSWQWVFEASGRVEDGTVLVAFDGADLEGRTPEDVTAESYAFVAARGARCAIDAELGG